MNKRQKKLLEELISENTSYWKPKSAVWFWLSANSFVFAFLENKFVPFKQNAEVLPYQILLGLIAAVLLTSKIIAIRNPLFKAKLYHYSQFIFGFGIFLTVWDLLTVKSGILPYPFFPSIAEIVNISVTDYALLAKSAAYSFRLFAAGLITGAALGIVSGILIGWSRQANYWLSPIIKITGIIPAVAWLPIALVVFPNSFITGIFLIFIASWFPVASMTAQGIASTPKAYFEAAKTLGADNKFLLYRVAVPNAMPGIFMGILTATAFSFTTLIVAEMVGAKAGLGFYFNWAKGWGAYSKVYAAIVILGIEFSIILALIGTLKNKVLSWQTGILK
jgi:NitT/TauT family transport system permease protein